ncbi:MAM and LDL-receptor class A domain-containing protein 1-like [Ptychodera flava]|uniref:MAM and LDL-receptor class A domain-containing protein 1-like n=1 Tax=Ptychodera flava TaxID=63121 RepID=UPI00396A261D
MKKSTKADNLEYESSSPFTQVYSFRQQIPSFHTFRSESGDGYSCDFETGMCGLSNKEGNPVKWVRNQGGTPTPNTGPSTDHTKSNNQGYYAFVNAALLGNGGKNDHVYRKIQRNKQQLFEILVLHVWTTLWVLTISVADWKTGTSATIWKRWFDQEMDGFLVKLISSPRNPTRWVKIEFEVYNRIAINAFEGDVALDDIAIVSGSCEEIGDCDFDLDMCSWTNDAGNDFDWSRQKAGDMTVGPRKDHTLSSENVYFVHLALQSSTGSDRESRLISQQFSSTDVNGRCLQFWYYTVGSTGTITIYVDYGSTFPFEQPYWSLTGSSTNDWQRGFVPVVSEVDYKSAYPPVDTQSRPTAPPHVSTQYDCDFELGSLCSWTQSKTDHFDWKAIQAKSNGGHGPVIDQTRRTGNGWYIYIESEDQTVGDKAQLLIFEAECGSSYHGDIALDGILYMNGECRFPVDPSTCSGFRLTTTFPNIIAGRS